MKSRWEKATEMFFAIAVYFALKLALDAGIFLSILGGVAAYVFAGFIVSLGHK
jgi:hypothetical protein